jgi:hypothetical protein
MTLTFEEWWDIWQKSGKYPERGAKPGKYCMSRFNDSGPYSKDNVFIQLWTQNTSDAWVNGRQDHQKRPCCVHGITYSSVRSAAKANKITEDAMRERLKRNMKGHSYL